MRGPARLGRGQSLGTGRSQNQGRVQAAIDMHLHLTRNVQCTEKKQ